MHAWFVMTVPHCSEMGPRTGGVLIDPSPNRAPSRFGVVLRHNHWVYTTWTLAHSRPRFRNLFGRSTCFDLKYSATFFAKKS